MRTKGPGRVRPVPPGVACGVAVERYVALLRGINVGGRNKIPMADLRAVFEDAGHTDVRSYIQSGQVVFASSGAATGLEAALERAVGDRFGLSIPIVLVSHAQLRSVVADAPEGFGQAPDRYHSDVIFLKQPMTPEAAIDAVRLRDGVDQVWTGAGVLYFARLSARRTQSLMGKIAGTPAYKLMTIRSWKTTITLLEMLDAPDGREIGTRTR